jgi:AraC family transcriptional regulator
MPGQPTLSSEHTSWNGIFVRRFHIIRGEVVMPGLSDYGIAIQLSRPINLTRRLAGVLVKGRVQPGDITIVPKEAPTEWYLSEPADLLHLHVDPSLVAQIADQVIDTDPSRIEIVDRLGVRDPLIQHIGAALLSELQTGGIIGRLYAESLAHTLAMHLVRQHSTILYSSSRNAGGLPPRKLQRALDYINDNLALDIPLADLAAIVDLSPYHFTRLFKQSMNIAPHQYLIEQRIVVAKRLLTETQLPIADIAYQVGFNSQSHFTTLFRKRVGATPAAYRNAL